MAVDPSALKTELEDDPTSLGYRAYAAPWTSPPGQTVDLVLLGNDGDLEKLINAPNSANALRSELVDATVVITWALTDQDSTTGKTPWQSVKPVSVDTTDARQLLAEALVEVIDNAKFTQIDLSLQATSALIGQAVSAGLLTATQQSHFDSLGTGVHQSRAEVLFGQGAYVDHTVISAALKGIGPRT